MKSWVKLYTEINRDPKMVRLTWAHKGIWAALLALAGEIDVRNGDGQETGQIYSVEDTALIIRCDIAEFTEAVEVFSRPILEGERGMLYDQDGILFITNYGKRQARPASARPEAVKKRVANHRARLRNKPVTTPQRDVTSSEENRIDTDKSQNRIDTEADFASPFQEAVRIWEDLMGRITERTTQQFDMAADEYGEERLLYAVKEAHDHNAKSWAYVEAVLEGRGRSPPGKVSIEDQWLAEQTDGE